MEKEKRGTISSKETIQNKIRDKKISDKKAQQVLRKQLKQGKKKEKS